MHVSELPHIDSEDHISHESEKVHHLEELCVANSENCYNSLKMFYERDEFHKEIAKLKCLVLHLFERVADTEAAEWAELTSTWYENKVSKLCKRHEEQWSRIAKKCGDEYRKMKAELMMKEK